VRLKSHFFILNLTKSVSAGYNISIRINNFVMLKKLKPLKFGAILIISIILTLGFSISLQSLLATWTAPASVPPTNNIADFIVGGNLGVVNNSLVMGNLAASGTKMALFADTTVGNVGIGTTTLNARLSIDGSATFSNGLIRFDGQEIMHTPANPFYINSNNTIQFRFNTNGGAGEFGINQGIANSRLFTIRDSGNIGIGTINPTEKLEVNGNIKAADVCTTAGKCLSAISNSGLAAVWKPYAGRSWSSSYAISSWTFSQNLVVDVNGVPVATITSSGPAGVMTCSRNLTNPVSSSWCGISSTGYSFRCFSVGSASLSGMFSLAAAADVNCPGTFVFTVYPKEFGFGLAGDIKYYYYDGSAWSYKTTALY